METTTDLVVVVGASATQYLKPCQPQLPMQQLSARVAVTRILRLMAILRRMAVTVLRAAQAATMAATAGQVGQDWEVVVEINGGGMSLRGHKLAVVGQAINLAAVVAL